MSARSLSRLTLAQFRSYDHAEATFDGRPVVLTGPNGAGKTNLLEAVSLFSPGRGLRGAPAAEMARQPGTLGWRLRGLFGGTEIVLTGLPEGRRRIEIDGKAAAQTALGALPPMLWLTPAMDRLWLDGAEARRRFLDRAALSFVPAHASASLRYERAMRERNRLLRDGPMDPRWLDALEAQMAEAGLAVAQARVMAAARLKAAQADAKTLFPKADIAIVGAMEERLSPPLPGADGAAAKTSGQASEIMEDFRVQLARGRDADAAAGRTRVGPHRSDIEVSMAEKAMAARLCSTGEQKALLLSLILANARALATDGESNGAVPILLLDEVAAHFDEARRAALFDELCALGVQALLTGTGPAYFDALGDRAQHLAIRETAAGSLIGAAA